MAGHYNPKHFLRQIPNSLLKEFFDRRGELSSIQWSNLDEMDVEGVFEAWQNLPPASRNDIERWFRATVDLATPEGLQTLIEESTFHNVDLASVFASMTGIHEKVFWVCLHHQKMFLAAGRLNRADHLNGRYWRRRTDLPAKQPDLSHEARQLLGEAISEYYREHQGRGERCQVEVYLRRPGLHYFFAYPANYADTVIVYDEEGQLERQLQRAAFEVIFAYNESNGTLDVFIQGDKKIRHDMEELFARIVLSEELPANQPDSDPYRLNGLLHRDFDFPTDPADNIRDVRVKALRLSVIGPGLGRITLESDSRRKKGDIYDLMEKGLNQDWVSAKAFMVTRAEIAATFSVEGKDKPVTFVITHPDACSLKDSPEHLKLKEYLKRWGIANEN